MGFIYYSHDQMQLSIAALRDTCFSRRASSALGLREEDWVLGTQSVPGKYIQEMKESKDESLVLHYKMP